MSTAPKSRSEQLEVPMPDPARALEPAYAYQDWQIRGCMRIEDEYRVIVRDKEGREHRALLYLADDRWSPLGCTAALDRSWWATFPTTENAPYTTSEETDRS